MRESRLREERATPSWIPNLDACDVVKHSRHFHARLGEARDALLVVHQLADDFAAEVAELTRTTVTDQQWGQFLDQHVPRTDPTGQPFTGRAKTQAENRRQGLQRLYRRDHRAAPWQGTALGVVQAVNTYDHHVGTVRGTTRAERNMLRTVKGDFDTLDKTTLTALDRVLHAA